MSPRTAEPVCPPAEAEGASGGALAGWARRFRPLPGAPVRTRLPPGPPVRPLLVGGGAGWELMPPALVRLCPVASGVLRVVLSLLVVPGVTCSPWIRSVFGFRVRGFEFIIDIIYPSWDCVFAAHGHSCFLVSEEPSSRVWSDVMCRCPGGPHPAAGPVQTACSEASRALC